jgi:hypothetical protein
MNEIYGKSTTVPPDATTTHIPREKGNGPQESGPIGPISREMAWIVSTAKERGRSMVLSKVENLAVVAEETAAALRRSAQMMAERESPAISHYCALTANGLKAAASGLRSWDLERMAAGGRRFASAHPLLFLGGTMAAGLLTSRREKARTGRDLTPGALQNSRRAKRVRERLATLTAEDPFALGIFAFSAGALLGAALTALAREDRPARPGTATGASPVTGWETELAAELAGRSQAGGFGPEETELEVEPAQ